MDIFQEYRIVSTKHNSGSCIDSRIDRNTAIETIGASLCQPVPSACKRFTANGTRVSSQEVDREEVENTTNLSLY